MEINIRRAQENDIPQIFNLVKELAEYEKAGDQVWTNVDIYYQDFNSGHFKSIVADQKDKILGTCIYYPAYSTWKGKMMYLEDFVILPEYRRMGIGQRLFDYFIEVSKADGCKLIKWEVLDWNEPAIKFYEKNNAKIKKNWWDGLIYFNV